MSRPALLHLITGAEVGGTEMMLLRQLPLLEQYFVNTVCVIRGRGQIGQALETKGIKVYYLDLKNWFDWRVVYRFYSVVCAVRPDILVTYLIHADLFGRILGRLYGIRHVICSQRGSLLQWDFLRIFDRLTKPLVSLYTVQTPAAKAKLQCRLNLNDNDIAIIPNGINQAVFATPVNFFDKRRELGVPDDAIVITCVSHLRRGKGQQYLLEAFESIAKDRLNLHVLLVGEGTERTFLEKFIIPYATRLRIHFVGDRRDVIEILKVSNIFVMPTIGEGMSNALIEAMGSGLPCIVSNIPENRSVVRHGNNGLLFENMSSQSLTVELNTLLADGDLQRRLGQVAQREIAEKYDIGVVTQNLARVYQTELWPSLCCATRILSPNHTNITPVVSVVIAIFNGTKTLDQCLQSVTNQTFKGLEVICVDDCSSDNTLGLLKQWQQKTNVPLKIIQNSTNIGLTKSLNIGLREARGTFVARIDADDWWHPDKLTKQISFLQANRDYGLIGCFYTNVSHGRELRITLPVNDNDIKRLIFRRNPFGHSCIVIKRELLQLVGGYDEKVRYGQDYDTWFRLLPHTRMYNLPEYLCTRKIDLGISVAHARQQMIQSLRTTIRYIRRYHAPAANYAYLINTIVPIILPKWLIAIMASLPKPSFLRQL